MSRQDSLQGALPLLVLKLLGCRGPLHGYGLTAHIESLSEEVLSVEEGSLYPSLHRMEETGWIKASWVTTENSRRARLYEITAAGRKELEEQEARRRSVNMAIGRVLQRAQEATMSWLSRLAYAIRSDRLDRDLAEEIRLHIEQRRRGMSPEDAARAAASRFGNQLRLRESSREAKLLPWVESIAQDVRFGLRMLRKNPAFTCAAVLSLSLAIRAATAAFNLLDSLVLRRLPVRAPEMLVGLTYSQDSEEADGFSYPLL